MSRCQEFCARLSGLQEVPPIHALNQQPASGKVHATLKCNKLTVWGKFKNLSSPLLPVGGSPAHIHFGAPGATGDVIFPLKVHAGWNQRAGYLDPCRNTFHLTETQVRALNSGDYYVNIHTETNPKGEIRGQLLTKVNDCRQYLVVLAGGNEVPPVTTQASGTLLASYNRGKLVLNGTFKNLSSQLLSVGGSPAHVHQGAAGVNGPIVFPLQVVNDANNLGGKILAKDNKYRLTRDQKELLHNQELYVNIHTINHPSGEIRGQLVPLH